jgi:hypothetical protein
LKTRNPFRSVCQVVFNKSINHQRSKILKPRKTTGLYNQKPLTIKPYPMKIRIECNVIHRYD